MNQSSKVLRTLLLVGVAFSLLGNLQRFVLPGTTIAWYGHEVIFCFFVLLGLLGFRGKILGTLGSLGTFNRILLGVVLLSFLLPFHHYSLAQNLIAGLYLARVFLYVLVGLIARQILTNDDSKWILPFSLIGIILGFIQLVLLPDLRPFAYLGWDDHFGRLFGSYFDPSTAAAMIGGMVLLSLETLKGKWRYIVAALGGLALILTFSRSGYIALIGTMGITNFKGSFGALGKSRMMIILGGAVIFLFLIPKPHISEGFNLFRTASIQGRLDDSKKAVEVIKKNSLFGVGYNRIRFQRPVLNEISVSDASYASSYLTMWATVGTIGMLGILGLLVQLFKKLEIGRPAFAYLLVMGIFDNVLLVNFVMLVIILLFSLNFRHSELVSESIPGSPGQARG